MQKMEQIPWFKEALELIPKDSKIGYDPLYVTAFHLKVWEKNWKPVGIELISIERNLVDEIWGNE